MGLDKLCDGRAVINGQIYDLPRLVERLGEFEFVVKQNLKSVSIYRDGRFVSRGKTLLRAIGNAYRNDVMVHKVFCSSRTWFCRHFS
jgi:hypothetical protein